MSNDWEVKKVTKSGNDYNITVGPTDSGEGALFAIMALIMTLATMHVFDLTGWTWGIILWLLFAGISAVFFIPALIVSILIVVGFFAF